MTSHANDISDQPLFFSDLSENWAGGANKNKVTSNAYYTNDPHSFSCNLSELGRRRKTMYPSQMKEHPTLRVGEMFIATGKYLRHTVWGQH